MSERTDDMYYIGETHAACIKERIEITQKGKQTKMINVDITPREYTTYWNGTRQRI